MRVLVTGGAGFIGSHLTDALLARGDEVAVVDDLSAGRPGRLHEDAVLHKLSITAAGPLAALIGELRPELVCHLAAQIDVRASVAAPAADAAGQRRRHRERAGGGPGGRRAGAVLLHRRRPVRQGRADPVAGGRAAAAGVALRGGQAVRGAVRRPVQPAARHRARRAAAVQRVRPPPGPGRGVGRHPDLLLAGPGRRAADHLRGRAGRPATTSTSGDAVAAFLAAADRGRPGTWNIGTGREVSVLELAGVIGAGGRPRRSSRCSPRPGRASCCAAPWPSERAERDLGWRPATSLADGRAPRC